MVRVLRCLFFVFEIFFVPSGCFNSFSPHFHQASQTAVETEFQGAAAAASHTLETLTDRDREVQDSNAMPKVR